MATEREFGSNFAPLKTRVLDLIKFDVTQVEKRKGGTTNADFSVTVGAGQLKRFDQVQEAMRRHLPWLRRTETVLALLSRTDSELVCQEM